MQFRHLALVAALVCAQGVAVAGDSRFAAQDGQWLPDVNTTRDSAAGFAITRAIVVNEVALRCAALDADLASRAHAARDDWWARNQLMVEAANGYVRYLQAIRQVRHGEEAARAFYDAVFAEVQQDGDAAVAALVPAGGDDAATCERTVASYADGRMDLSADADQYATLVSVDRDLRTYRGQQ